MRRFLDTLVLLIAAGLLVHTWLLHGWLFPDVVVNSSMAPALRGPHRLVVCRACGLRFTCDSFELPPSAAAICPNCGTTDLELASLPNRPGDRLIVDRATWNWQLPGRWDVTVLRSPADPGTLLVKRIVGLPGETVEIRSGDVYVNGAIARKSLPQLRRMAILVNDDDHRMSSGQAGASSRWEPENEETLWSIAAKGWTRAAGIPAAAEFYKARPMKPDWLVYHHAQPPAVPGGRPVPGPILDDYAYNVKESRPLQTVHDLLLRCHIQAVGEGDLWLQYGNDPSSLTIRVSAATGKGELITNAGPSHEITLDSKLLAQGAVLELAFVDGQLLLALDGNLVAQQIFEPSPVVSERPLAIGATGTAVVLRELAVLRDVYYLPAAGRAARTCCRLGPHEYFVLGDNSPVSLDSRSWNSSAVSGDLLIGRVLKVLAADREDK